MEPFTIAELISAVIGLAGLSLAHYGQQTHTASDVRNRQLERVEAEARRVEEESTRQMARLRKLLEKTSLLTP